MYDVTTHPARIRISMCEKWPAFPPPRAAQTLSGGGVHWKSRVRYFVWLASKGAVVVGVTNDQYTLKGRSCSTTSLLSYNHLYILP